ncbi:MAG: class I SAM-dependent methyltransferase [Candidatus Kariarchaeaceae archaeon]|jgi:magnesium-protoporphyrin O-methyltransferase
MPTSKGKAKRALYLANWYQDAAKPVDVSSFGWTAKLHVEKIIGSGLNSVYDIGCGAGGILLALQKSDIQILHGIDASPEAIELATKRFSQFGNLDGVKLIVGDAAKEATPSIDAVSLHRVVCCYPNVESLLTKATETMPKLLVLTFPRNRWYVKLITLLENIGLRILSIFRSSSRGMGSFVHNPKEIAKLLESKGYQLQFEKKGFYWQTDVYSL